MVITDNNFFGKSTESEIIPILLSIILIYSLYLLIRKYIDSMHKNIYQYRNVSYLGIIIFICSFALSTILSVFNYQGLYETINTTIGLMSALSLILFPIAIVTFILVTISNIKLIIKEGKSFRNLLGLLIEGMGSNTKPYFWINAFIREFIGTLNSEKKKHIIMLILIILILILMISITYFANNI